MTDFNFKEGDRVYYPAATNEVLQVDSNLYVSYICAGDEGTSAKIYNGGKFYSFHRNPAFFPATQEWYDKLVHVYPDLEKPAPPSVEKAKQIIQKMRDDGWRYVPCCVSNSKELPTRYDNKEYIDCIIKRDPDGYNFGGLYGNWVYATPFDPRTGNPIADYVDGEVVFDKFWGL